MSTGGTIAVAVGAALFGALATGGVQVALALWDRRSKTRVAAMAVLGDIAVAEKAFKLVVETRRWWDTIEPL